MALRPAAAMLPENLLEIEIIGPRPDPLHLRPRGRARNLHLHEAPGDSDAHVWSPLSVAGDVGLASWDSAVHMVTLGIEYHLLLMPSRHDVVKRQRMTRTVF